MEMAALLLLATGISAFTPSSQLINTNGDEYYTISHAANAASTQKKIPYQVTDNVVKVRRANATMSTSAIYVQALRRQTAAARVSPSGSTQHSRYLPYNTDCFFRTVRQC